MRHLLTLIALTTTIACGGGGGGGGGGNPVAPPLPAQATIGVANSATVLCIGNLCAVGHTVTNLGPDCIAKASGRHQLINAAGFVIADKKWVINDLWSPDEDEVITTQFGIQKALQAIGSSIVVEVVNPTHC